MPSPKPPDPEEDDPSAEAAPASDGDVPASQPDGSSPDDDGPTPPSAGRPKSAPGAATGGERGGHGHGHGKHGHKRKPSLSKKPEPTLLTDFFMGKPSPQRLAAQRQERERRKSLAAAAAAANNNNSSGSNANNNNNTSAATKQEMKQSAVRKLQPPGGVHSRVRSWQKVHGAVMAAADPVAPPTEPSDVAFAGEDLESVTEEDRIRIRMRMQQQQQEQEQEEEQKQQKQQAQKQQQQKQHQPQHQHQHQQKKPAPKKHHRQHHHQRPDASGGAAAAESPAQGRTGANDSAEKLHLNGAPKKRVVSDEHWLKRKGRNPQPAAAKEAAPAPLPKDFLQRTARNPTVAKKIRDWAERVEVPDPSRPPRPPPSLLSSLHGDDENHDQGGDLEDAADPSPSEEDSDVTEFQSPRSRASGASKKTAPAPAPVPAPDHDGIRVRPMVGGMYDDGIRVRPIDVEPERRSPRPTPAPRPDSRTASASRHASSSSRPVSRTNRGQATTRPGLARDSYIDDDPDHILVVEENEHAQEEDRIEVVEEPAPTSGTPTATNKPTRRRSSRKKRPKSLPTAKKSSDPGDGAGSWVDEDESSSRASPPKAESDLTANTLNTGAINLAEIPFGFSAFSELHLPDGHDKEHPHGGASRRKPAPPPPPPNKTRRTSSFRAVPKVLGKIVSEGRKIIQETVDPPRQVANQPPSIEKWLNSTVDPFVYGATAEASNGQRKRTMEQEWVEDAHTRRKPATSPTDGGPEATAAPAHEQQQQQSESRGGEFNRAEPRRGAEELPARSPSSPGVKRSKATRGPAPPLRTATFRMPPPLKEVFKEAFRGESNGSPYTAASYETKEIRAYESPDEGSDTEPRSPRSPPPPPPGGDGGSGSGSSARRSSGSRSRRSESASERRTEKAESEPGPSEPSDATPVPPTQGPRRKPPTRGVHELSTILSAVSGSAVTSSAIESELSSVLSHTTITQSTGLTTKEDTATTPTTPDPMARKRSGGRQPSRSRSGLRRRLTRHSDLVSVLSLPDAGDGKISRDASRRSRPSLRRVQPGSGAALDALVSEFTTDENLYQRELKTLVDGVIPVLLSEAIHSAAEGRSGQMFGDFSEYHGEDVSRAVVDMGVALEKLKNYHRRAPCGDAQRLLIWLRAVAPIYGSYLTVWRLGFHGIVVNLAPPNEEGDRDDVDEDSLLNALPRNANGDVINDEGERVDVAHFLRRPLFRVKTMAKFLKGVNAVLATDTTRSLAKQYDALHERARRRQKEELARITDLDAVKSDTTRARDLRTMSAADSVVIHPYRQVSAKDLFDFSLIHSNGQRLECQVELVHRDNQAIAGDEGDVLIREAGQGQAQGQTGGQIGATKSWLLFPPITIPQVSARQGTTPRDLIVMVRGSHQGRDWYELFALTADNEAQVLDWLDILGTHPVPPSELAPVTAPEPLRHGGGAAAAARRASFSPAAAAAAAADIPVGARREPEQPAVAPIPRSLPSRLHPRRSGLPPIPTISKTTPTQESYNIDQALEELDRASAAAAAAATAKSYREDGAPPPPAHRSTGKAAATAASHQPQHHLQPPVDLRAAGGVAGVKRRNSSPLKHEYLPSEHSERSEEDNEDDYGDSLGSETGTETETGSLSGSETEDEEDEEEEDELESVGVPQTAIGISIRHDRPTAIPASLLSSCSSLTPSHSASQMGLHHTHRRQAGGPSLPVTSAAAAAAAADDTADEPTPIVIRYTATVSYWYEKRGIWKELSDGPLSVAVGPGVLQVYRYGETAADGEAVLALDLTPVVLLRRSTAVDLEVRSSVQPGCRIHHRLNGGNFRFRFGTMAECINLYSAVHHARLNNQKYIQLANEARFRSFGERERPSGGSDEDQGSSGGGGGSRARRGGGWLGRRNSYRAPSSRRQQQQQQDRLSSSATTPSSSSSSPSASSFLRRLAGTANLSFNLARSGVQLHRQGSIGSSGSGRPESANLSLSASASSSSAAGGHYHYNTPRSPSVSLSSGAIRGAPISPDEPIPIRLHLLVSASRWEDRGNCRLLISRPPAGWHQELRANHGLEKRITVTTAPRRKMEEPRIVLDAVLGSGCFSLMGSRGVVCGIWEGYYDMIVPPTGNPAGTVRKWCFQCSTPTIASWVLRLVHEEVLRA